MKTAAAIVTTRGGRTCHAAIIARELGIPAVVGTVTGTSLIKEGDEVTVSCAGGEVGTIYRGSVPFKINRLELKDLARPVTAIQINLGNPDLAFKTSFLPNDGPGGARGN
jgi:pyruvate,water dikinase